LKTAESVQLGVDLATSLQDDVSSIRGIRVSIPVDGGFIVAQFAGWVSDARVFELTVEASEVEQSHTVTVGAFDVDVELFVVVLLVVDSVGLSLGGVGVVVSVSEDVDSLGFISSVELEVVGGDLGLSVVVGGFHEVVLSCGGLEENVIADDAGGSALGEDGVPMLVGTSVDSVVGAVPPVVLAVFLSVVEEDDEISVVGGDSVDAEELVGSRDESSATQEFVSFVVVGIVSAGLVDGGEGELFTALFYPCSGSPLWVGNGVNVRSWCAL